MSYRTSVNNKFDTRTVIAALPALVTETSLLTQCKLDLILMMSTFGPNLQLVKLLAAVSAQIEAAEPVSADSMSVDLLPAGRFGLATLCAVGLADGRVTKAKTALISKLLDARILGFNDCDYAVAAPAVAVNGSTTAYEAADRPNATASVTGYFETALHDEVTSVVCQYLTVPSCDVEVVAIPGSWFPEQGQEYNDAALAILDRPQLLEDCLHARNLSHARVAAGLDRPEQPWIAFYEPLGIKINRQRQRPRF